LVVITGCAHPGVVNVAEAARRHAGKPVFAVVGGFHMGNASVDEIHRVVRDLREMGVQQVAPCHCSGDRTRRLMKDAFREGYLPSGVGAQFAFGQLSQSENP
jgi:7,8-dihydropterin-6-yl-methyl-4-(beta-D-ribofuranosyl)aminobenzene 5'-phosphate synthase